MLPLLMLTDQKLMPLAVCLTGRSRSSITIPGLQTLVVIGALVSVLPIVAVLIALQRCWKSDAAAGSFLL